MDRTETLAELVSEAPARAFALDRLGLDYCCGGDERFDEACARAGLIRTPPRHSSTTQPTSTTPMRVSE